ncbi:MULTISPECIES: DNA polymerase III subunit gamma/tau [unclassified Campylobacter]|uniref:DNA polymerase III subunit gamma/tau n=1 Tax=unclassified Campylobacter TaxID=2593542 RepID=UPI0012382ED8|nr:MULTISPECIES: DNA polymerase III subunit gamma/tau [unclassified Campylobacter]KAA6226727.1 DNA polymerase III subunit gamma/tau [Campylobacter sp. LR196d]KAA6228677.1 DNA polymerase III subunit gamma/tau [Campylobacter sp. LR185c]KAA6229080.1 DNA polymerase III subunit gamma/tau [Campylobacter sp. LR286c]KAA6230164.1 DNA polymerase III subunit gamma/tau [Campylobacter sp. LR291e]KAA6233685.1 DNA polymerase III subunit gamma/tau [Campylobacter sp. LR264d]
MFQALALKYRPKTFDELVGQKTISISLKYALNSQKLAHAYLFSGLRGSGKTSSARIFSRALVCEKGPSATPCGECKQCLAALENKHIDIIEMDAASNRGLEDIQSLIEQTKYAPSMARFKIFIIDEVHMLTTQAANALLKTLEEPPAYVKFILATTDPLKLPATVLSRTQHFRFKQISLNEILSHLKNILEKENVEFEEEALKFIARSANGSLRDTLTLLDQAIIYCENKLSTAKITQMLGFLDPQSIKEFYQAILQRDKEKIFTYLKDLQDYEAGSVIDEMIFYLKEKFFEQSPEFSTLMYERFFRILSRAKTMISNDDGFTLCVMAFMMMEASNLKEIDAQITKIQNAPIQILSQNIQNPSSTKNTSSAKNAYDRLLELIYDRDFDLGDCFKKNTHFLSFENNILNISSSAENEDRNLLNKGFKRIVQLFQKEFGPNAKIEVKKAINIDESKLQSITQNNIKQDNKAHFESLIKDAKKFNKEDDLKETLTKYFGEPKIES